MNRRNFAITTLALSALAFAPSTACKKEGGGGATGSSADMLSYMPKDTSAVIGISWSKARSSDLFKKYEAKIMTGDAAKKAADMKEKCGIDIMADLKTVVVSMGKDIQDESDVIVAIKGNFDQPKVEACITKMGGTVEGGVYTTDGEPMNAYWPAADTMLFAKGLTAEQMKAATAAGTVKDNAPLMALIGKVDSGATLWGAGMVPPEAGAMMGGMGKPPTGAHLTVNVDSGVNATVGMDFTSEDDAKGMASMITMGLSMGKGQPGMKEILEGISSEQSGSVVTIKAKLSGEQIKQMEEMSGGMPF